jgi:hypothetical protein
MTDLGTLGADPCNHAFMSRQDKIPYRCKKIDRLFIRVRRFRFRPAKTRDQELPISSVWPRPNAA